MKSYLLKIENESDSRTWDEMRKAAIDKKLNIREAIWTAIRKWVERPKNK